MRTAKRFAAIVTGALLLSISSGSAAESERVQRFRKLHSITVADEGDRCVSDCRLFLSQQALRSKLVHELVSPRLDERIERLEATCMEGVIRMTGSMDGPLILDPSFSTDLEISVVSGDSIDLYVSRTKVVGFGLNVFSKKVCELFRDSIREKSKGIVEVSPLGKRSDGAHGLRLRLDMKTLAPLLDASVELGRIRITSEGLELGLRLP